MYPFNAISYIYDNPHSNAVKTGQTSFFRFYLYPTLSLITGHISSSFFTFTKIQTTTSPKHATHRRSHPPNCLASGPPTHSRLSSAPCAGQARLSRSPRAQASPARCPVHGPCKLAFCYLLFLLLYTLFLFSIFFDIF